MWQFMEKELRDKGIIKVIDECEKRAYNLVKCWIVIASLEY